MGKQALNSAADYFFKNAFGDKYITGKKTLGELMRRLHDLGWAHTDAHFGNIMISSDGTEARLIDLPSILQTKSRRNDGSIDSATGGGDVIFDIPGWNLELGAKFQDSYDTYGNPYELFTVDPRRQKIIEQDRYGRIFPRLYKDWYGNMMADKLATEC